MTKAAPITLAVLAVVLLTGAGEERRTYSWTDDEGVTHYGDKVPPEYRDQKKRILNEQGVTVGVIEGKKTPEELALEAKRREMEAEKEKRRRADKVLLSTYLSVEELEMHRDRRLELLRAQQKVAELYLRNLRRRMVSLQEEAGNYKPYTMDPDAEMIPPDLAEDLSDTKDRINRQEAQLAEHRREADQLEQKFAQDISRFRALKGY
ncbi:DUF4124 domain-containing protein [Lentisalinibacter orientalis]|uniref:DUF4124 domain-containing protein n=1 Tax=Lentisalinibacter orientalis TaxID=2992241 RepID=UPI00387087D5